MNIAYAGEYKLMAGSGHPKPSEDVRWVFKLYIAGQNSKSLVAFSNLNKICKEHMTGCCKIEIIDLLSYPELSKRDNIIAVPTLLRTLPKPVRKIVGDLSNMERVLVGLDLRPSNRKSK